MDPLNKIGSSCCVVPGCSMRAGTNLLSKIKMIRFPTNPERKLQWETAVRRENWISKSTSKICSNHFVTGKASLDPLHPNYVPSVFSFKKGSSEFSASRYERGLKRRKIQKNPPENPNGNDSSTDAEQEPKSKEVWTMTSLTKDDIEKLEQKINGYKSQVNLIQDLAKKDVAADIKGNLKMFQFYTKLPNVAFLYSLLTYILCNWHPTIKTVLEPVDQLLLVLIKLRLGLLNEDLAYRFKIGKGTVSCLFREWIFRMGKVLFKFIPQPSQRTINKHIPQCFLDTNLSKISYIIDCSEIFLEKPYNLDARAQTYSNYKHHNTVKFLISCSPSGCITFISQLYGGRASDKEITKMCGFLDIIQENDVILADRGFKIEELLVLKNASLIIPSSTKGKTQLSGADVINSRKISRVRVHIERCIARMKSYRILKSIWPIPYVSYSADGKTCTGDNILIVIAALCNMARPSIINNFTEN